MMYHRRAMFKSVIILFTLIYTQIFLTSHHLTTASSEHFGAIHVCIFCLKKFDTFTRTPVRVSKMNAVARAQ